MSVQTNVVCLGGCLTRDPEGFTTKSGKEGAKLGMANDSLGSDGAQFINVTLFGQAAVFAMEYLKKGATVIATGQLNQYVNDEGVKYTSLTCHKIDSLRVPEKGETF